MSPRAWLLGLGQRPALRASLLTAMLLGLLALYLSLARMFPFDMAWDMDLASVHDALLINSHRLPLHVDHPKFGMHLLTSWQLRAGRALGLISVADFADLRLSPSPLLCIAELVLYLRSCEAVLIWLILLLSAGLLWRLFPRRPWLRLLGLPLLGLQTGLLYSAAMLRTEAYSIFFLLLGLFGFTCLYQAARRRRRLRLEMLAWLCAGFCFGLALLTKVQALLTLPFVLMLIFYVYTAEAAGEAAEEPDIPTTLPDYLPLLSLSLLALSLTGLALLAGLALRSPSLPGQAPTLIPWQDFQAGKLGLAAFVSHLKLQLLWAGLVLASLGLSLLGLLRRHSPWRRFYALSGLFWPGLLVAVPAPLMVYLGQAGDLNRAYLLQMLQTCLWTDTNASSTVSAGNFANTLQFALITDKNNLLLALAALVIAAYLLLQPRQPKTALWACLAGFGAGTLLLLLGNRAILRDTIWFGFLGCLSVLVLILHCWRSPGLKPLLRGLLILCLLIPGLAGALRLGSLRDQFYLYLAPFKSGHYTTIVTAIYASRDMEYPQILTRAYGPELLTPNRPDSDNFHRAMGQARLLEPLRKIAGLPFLNRRLPVRALGLAEVGLPVWDEASGWARFDSLEPSLRGSILINPFLLTPGGPARSWIGMNDQSPLKERWLQSRGGQNIAIYPSIDTQLLIAVSQSDYQRLFQLPPDMPPPLQVRHSHGRQAYYLLQFLGDNTTGILKSQTGFSELDPDWLRGFRYPPFLLLRYGNAWGPRYPLWNDMQALIDPHLLPRH